jgi:8-oxo-dGTP pyrophosphatase MutT (NUDIX family)
MPTRLHKQKPAVELSRVTRHAGKCLIYQDINWRDPSGAERVWETVERVNDRAAVMTIPWLLPSQKLVLIRQYRPPAKSCVLEFPAGLIDEGEDAITAALRELHEEAGYVGRVTRLIPPTYNTPGLSGEAVYQAFIAIDETFATNKNPCPKPDDGEFIEVVTVAKTDFAGFIEHELSAGSAFDSKVMAYMLGASGVTA